MASESEEEDRTPQRSENILSTSTDHGVTRHTTSRAEGSQNPYNTIESVEMPGAFPAPGTESSPNVYNGSESAATYTTSASRTEMKNAPNDAGRAAEYTTPGTESARNIRDYGTESMATENFGSIVKEDGEYERLGLEHSQTSSTWAGGEKELHLKRTKTSRSARERQEFAPIRAGDAEELTRLASQLDGGGSLTRASTLTRGSELQRRDTLAGINVGDAVLDPKSPEFDPYKWARM